MAKRTVFEATDAKPYIIAHDVGFVWNKRLDVVQKRKNISAFQAVFLEYTNEMTVEQFANNFSPDVLILEPQYLCDRLRDNLEKSLEFYK